MITIISFHVKFYNVKPTYTNCIAWQKINFISSYYSIWTSYVFLSCPRPFDLFCLFSYVFARVVLMLRSEVNWNKRCMLSFSIVLLEWVATCIWRRVIDLLLALTKHFLNTFLLIIWQLALYFKRHFSDMVYSSSIFQIRVHHCSKRYVIYVIYVSFPCKFWLPDVTFYGSLFVSMS